jgi:hypothetical protein
VIWAVSFQIRMQFGALYYTLFPKGIFRYLELQKFLHLPNLTIDVPIAFLFYLAFIRVLSCYFTIPKSGFFLAGH